jgi:thermitase
MQLHLPPVYRGQEVFDQKAQALPWHIADVRLQDHWEHTGAGEGILYGVADTGIDADHPDIAGRIEEAASFINKRFGRDATPEDQNGHGTHVATTVAVMAPKAKFAIARVLGANGSGSNAGVAEGIRWLAERGCNIINLSLGGPQDDPLTREAVKDAKRKGCIIVIATGNEAANAVGFPAQHGVGVGAVDRGRKLAWFSNRGKHVDIVGFGVDILAGVPGGKYQLMSGTSMATPWVGAIAALRLSAELKHLGKIVTNSDDGLRKLETFVTDLGPEGMDTSYGRGMPDLKRCLYENLRLDPIDPSEPVYKLPEQITLRVGQTDAIYQLVP